RADVNAGSFRLDLYHRIAVVTLEVPPLRERQKDIPLLAEHFAREEGHEGPLNSVIPDEAMERLLRHRWPGNVRELRNYVQATVAMGEPVELRDAAVPSSFDDELRLALEPLLDQPYGEARDSVVDEFE